MQFIIWIKIIIEWEYILHIYLKEEEKQNCAIIIKKGVIYIYTIFFLLLGHLHNWKPNAIDMGGANPNSTVSMSINMTSKASSQWIGCLGLASQRSYTLSVTATCIWYLLILFTVVIILFLILWMLDWYNGGAKIPCEEDLPSLIGSAVWHSKCSVDGRTCSLWRCVCDLERVSEGFLIIY